MSINGHSHITIPSQSWEHIREWIAIWDSLIDFQIMDRWSKSYQKLRVKIVHTAHSSWLCLQLTSLCNKMSHSRTTMLSLWRKNQLSSRLFDGAALSIPCSLVVYSPCNVLLVVPTPYPARIAEDISNVLGSRLQSVCVSLVSNWPTKQMWGCCWWLGSKVPATLHSKGKF